MGKWLGALILAATSVSVVSMAEAGTAVRPFALSAAGSDASLGQSFHSAFAATDLGFANGSGRTSLPAFDFLGISQTQSSRIDVSFPSASFVSSNRTAVSALNTGGSGIASPTGPGLLSESHRDRLISEAMIDSYHSNGTESESVLLFWNETPRQANFSDMATDVKTTEVDAQPQGAPPLLIPLPPALPTGIMGLFTLGIIAALRRWRRVIA
jgi:hypothetical protein